MRRLIGTLVDPGGVALSGDLVFDPLTADGGQLIDIDGRHTLGAGGSYDINLPDNRYRVTLEQSDRALRLGEITLAGGADTDLLSLLPN